MRRRPAQPAAGGRVAAAPATSGASAICTPTTDPARPHDDSDRRRQQQNGRRQHAPQPLDETQLAITAEIAGETRKVTLRVDQKWGDKGTPAALRPGHEDNRNHNRSPSRHQPGHQSTDGSNSPHHTQPQRGQHRQEIRTNQERRGHEQREDGRPPTAKTADRDRCSTEREDRRGGRGKAPHRVEPRPRGCQNDQGRSRRDSRRRQPPPERRQHPQGGDRKGGGR
jgi:hypothetical protein